MVLRGGEMTTTATATATRQERSKSLHNFTLPNLKWGNQRHLKCMKIESISNGGDHRRQSPPLKFGESDHRRSNQLRNESEEEGIEEFREKMMSDLKNERVKITQSMFRKEDFGEEEEISPEREEISPVKPWNLRKRRAAACKEPNQIDKGRIVAIEDPSPLRGGVVEAETTTVRVKFSVNLSKKEIEEDFMAVLGHRPPRRPKKRPRTVQRKLDSMYPGLYLTEVTLDAYKVAEETKR